MDRTDVEQVDMTDVFSAERLYVMMLPIPNTFPQPNLLIHIGNSHVM